MSVIAQINAMSYNLSLGVQMGIDILSQAPVKATHIGLNCSNCNLIRTSTCSRFLHCRL